MTLNIVQTVHKQHDEFIADTDQRFADLLRKISMTGEAEADHKRADDALVALLTVLNCHKTVTAYREVKKWYS